MLFYDCCDPRFSIYAGRDKFENESLLENGFPEDIWFHVDKFSSSHVYLRIPLDVWRRILVATFPPDGLPPSANGGGKADKSGKTDTHAPPAYLQITEATFREHIPAAVIDQCSQLVKANSIEGAKQPVCDIVWTTFANMRKDQQTMDTGTVGFIDYDQVVKERAVSTVREIVKAIEKSKRDQPMGPADFQQARDERQADEIRWRKMLVLARKKAEEKERKEAEKRRELKSYSAIHQNDECKTSNDRGPGFAGTVADCLEEEDDFM